MSLRHGNKTYYQVLFGMNRSELLNSLAEEKGMRPTALIREMVYKELEKNLPVHLYKEAVAKDNVIWQRSVSNRVKGRNQNRQAKEVSS